MAYLLDTSILIRLANSTDPKHAIAADALLELHRRGEELRLTSQVLIEFRNVATRPTAVNGLGMSAPEAESVAQDFEDEFPVLPETAAIYPAWKQIVSSYGIVGKQVHDARLVAVCHVHSMTHVLTFNSGHFSRLASLPPGLTVSEPSQI